MISQEVKVIKQTQKPDDISCKMEEDKNQDEKAMRMIASLQLEKRTKTKMMIKIMMMSEILRRNQAIKGIWMSMGLSMKLDK